MAMARGVEIEGYRGDRLITRAEAAAILCVTERWLQKHSRELPFVRRLTRGMVRYSADGIGRYIDALRAR